MFFFGGPGRWEVCRVGGIPVRLDVSLAFLLIFFCTGAPSLFSGLLCAAMLLVSITLHELGHAFAARAFGCPTRDITLSLLGGCASLARMPEKPWQEFATAAAGPAVSFVLCALGAAGVAICAESGGAGDALAYVVGDVIGTWGIPNSLGGDIYVSRDRFWLVYHVLYFASMNAMLGFFNLLPGFPMDGGRIFRSVMGAFATRQRATYVAMVVGRVFAVLIGLNGVWKLMNGSWGIVTVFIAYMIWKEGWREYMQVVREEDWSGGWGYAAKVSPPPWGGRSERAEVRRVDD